jgi:hypothetical protein
MTTGWLIVNIALAVIVTTLVAGLAVLVPLRLDRGVATTPGPGAAPLALRQVRWTPQDGDLAQAA